MAGAWVSPTSQTGANAILAALNLDPRPPPVRHSLFHVGDLVILADDDLFGYIVAVGWPSSPASSSTSASSSNVGSGTQTPTSSSSNSASATDLFKDREHEKPDALPKPTYILDRMLYSSTASLTVLPGKALLKPCASRGETLRAFPKEFKKMFPSFECVEIGVWKKKEMVTREGRGEAGDVSAGEVGNGLQCQYEYEYLIEARWGLMGRGSRSGMGRGRWSC